MATQQESTDTCIVTGYQGKAFNVHEQGVGRCSDIYADLSVCPPHFISIVHGISEKTYFVHYANITDHYSDVLMCHVRAINRAYCAVRDGDPTDVVAEDQTVSEVTTEQAGEDELVEGLDYLTLDDIGAVEVKGEEGEEESEEEDEENPFAELEAEMVCSLHLALLKPNFIFLFLFILSRLSLSLTAILPLLFLSHI